MKVLIAYDGSDDAEAALRDLEAAGLPSRVQALVLTVSSPWRPAPSDRPTRRDLAAERIAARALEEARSLAEGAAGTLRGRFPAWRVEAKAVLGSPAEAILSWAESWKADMLVMGCHGRTALGRLLMGSVSQKVLQHAPCDVRVTRSRNPSATGGIKVLVAVDGSTASDRAVDAAAARRWPAGTRIKAVAALDEDGLERALKGIRAAASRRDPRARWIEKKSAAAVARLEAAGHRAEARVLLGDARICLLREAADWGADVILMGSRGLGGLERFLLGSVSGAVSVHAPCTVEVVRKPTRKPRAAAGRRMAGVA